MMIPFTSIELEQAKHEWGCNCGPAALAFALQVSLKAARHAIPGFEQKGFTNPTDMLKGVRFFLATPTEIRFKRPEPGRLAELDMMFTQTPALIFVQWTGPWSLPGANPRWGYRMTHWIATWTERGVPLLYDINGGIMSLSEWEENLLPILTKKPRADGGWWPWRGWRITKLTRPTDE